MISPTFCRKLIVLFSLLAAAPNLRAQVNVDSLRALAEAPGPDSSRGDHYLKWARAIFWEQPDRADSLLTISKQLLSTSGDYRSLSDVHNLRANYHFVGGRDGLAETSLMEALRFGELAGDSTHVMGLRKNLAMIMAESGNQAGALENIQRNIDYLLRARDTSLLAQHYLERGAINEQRGQKRRALEDYYAASDLFRAIDDRIGMAQAGEYVGTFYYNDGDPAKAAPVLTTSRDAYAALKRPGNVAQLNSRLGTIASISGDYTLADSLFKVAVDESTSLGQSYTAAHASFRWGESFLQRGQYERAMELAVVSRAAFREIGAPGMEAETLMLHAMALNGRGQFGEALAVTNEALEKLDVFEYQENRRDLYELKATALRGLRRPAEALEAYDAYREVSDSLFNLERANAISALREEYEAELLERENKLQASEIENLDRQLEVETLRNTLLVGSVLLLALLAAVIWWGMRQRLRRQRDAAAAEEKRLADAVKFRERELAAQTLHLVQKNEFLREVGQRVSDADGLAGDDRRRLLNALQTENALDQDWRTFSGYFASVHGNFDERLRAVNASLSETELRLARLLRIGTTNAEIATLLHVQSESVRKAKYRLKQKLDLAGEVDLGTFLREV